MYYTFRRSIRSTLPEHGTSAAKTRGGRVTVTQPRMLAFRDDSEVVLRTFAVSFFIGNYRVVGFGNSFLSDINNNRFPLC